MRQTQRSWGARTLTLGRGLAGAGQAVIEGRVTVAGDPPRVGYVRLLNADGEFVAEVALGEDGEFRFFAARGDWTVRVLAPGGTRADRPVSADYGHVSTVDLSL